MPNAARAYIIYTQFGAYCSACQSPLSCEEEDWGECDTCGGEGMGGDDSETEGTAQDE